ncbi:MAG: hypothetical protein JRH01_01845 [Deltaproteobacteria bacterium]|nr:hypothetical protein [Deltaproteobacteria bacterium]MBW2395987.1 hypothetical protein [Deltaproteobacteria bacterium]
MLRPRPIYLALAGLLAFALASSAIAVPILDGSFAGFSGSETVIDFDEVALTPWQSVTTEFAGLGITFSPNVWFENTRNFTNFDGASMANFRSSGAPGGALPPIAFSVSFATSMTDFAAFFASNSGQTITLTAFLGATLVETLSFTDAACCNGHVLGFSGIGFDRIDISGTNLIIFDEFHFENVAEPATALMLVLGLAGLALAGRPAGTRSQA